MFVPLLSTKLYFPGRQRLNRSATLLSRPRLIRQLEDGLGKKLTLIAAPAGSGKSTLLSEWIGDPQTVLPHSHPTFCWLSLDENDNDLIRFWHYFIAALQSADPNLSKNVLPLLQSPEPPQIETVLTILLNDLDAWLSTLSTDTTPEEMHNAAPALVLVLEDYHVVTTPTIHASVTFLLEHLSPALHLVISTRADPPLPLARLRARNQLSEIRVDDLRFTPAEAADFLNDRMALALSVDEIQLLLARTEGWIVGLQLAALSMQGHTDKADFLHSFSGGHRYILSYLIEEVLNRQSKAVEEFLLYTSILNRLCGPLCDALFSTDPAPDSYHRSQSFLEQLEQANLFLVPLDDHGRWYRYHQLFAEVLQHRLHQRQPTLIPTLHQRASFWFAQQGYLADAITHALLGNDFPHAATLIEEGWSTLWDQGATATLFTWMQALPETVVGMRPGLYVSYAWALALTGQIAVAEATLSTVETTLQGLAANAATASTPYILLGRTTALRAMLAARRGEPTAAVQLAARALNLLPMDPGQEDGTQEDVAYQGEAQYALGLAQQQQGALLAAYQAYEQAAQQGVAGNDSFLWVAARYHEARILMVQGHLQQAAATYQQILALAAQSQKQLPVVSLAHVGYAEVLYQWNDLPAAAQQVELGLALSPNRDLTYTDGPLHRFSLVARIRQAMGDRQGALAAVVSAKETAQQTEIALDLERAEALAALIYLRLGETALATPWAEHYAQTEPTEERFAYLHEFETLTFVRVLLTQGASAQGDVATLLTMLDEWRSAIETTERQGAMFEIDLLQVLVLRLDGQIAQAMHLLAQILTRAEPEGYIRLFVDEGAALREAIAECSAGHPQWPSTLQRYVLQLLDAFTLSDTPVQAQQPEEIHLAHHALDRSSSDLVEPLTDRELEILRLVSTGLSNAAIAGELVIAVGTVKTHLKRVYGKLDVNSRTQAVAQARNLALL